ncbi:hypothetical protein O181_017354 [Austropuccinia psidii MF-1]|uniref:Uncharacterized protein n=1 Tax=Austropuccinia psidii MF-1 TaxID=1389203 RepID=A0A9Q3GSP2_9BASI|nr:hypothetical protein [Austropuccinia psidii MF-1]
MFPVCLARKLWGNPLQAQVALDEPSQHDETPIPAPDSQLPSHESDLTCEPEPEVAPTQKTEDSVAHPTTPTQSLSLTIHKLEPPVPSPEILPVASKNPILSSPHTKHHSFPG